MERELRIEDEETLDLLSDPYTLDILNVLEDRRMSREDVGKRLGERDTLVSYYLDALTEAGLIIEDDGRYQAAARTFNAVDGLLNSCERTATNWIVGFINHMENNICEQFKLLERAKGEGEENSQRYIDQYYISHNQMYLNEGEIEELHELLKNFVREKGERDRVEDGEYRRCHLYNFFFPDIG